ncbi:ferritin-like domain-containing protein [Conexibacter sp. DBS9H8]|uniref:ferritin-like domain-containing protein n=1 Tax=Conexibacter sp. DBS9H8 TaxID=2937801 RepID=UPI00200CC03D|nr:ferritin-like domain-containing protein [Conexibacter sp. DBS9H8]
MNPTVQGDTEQSGIVVELARDDVARKKFLKMAGKGMGSAVAASGLAAFIAACGSSSNTATKSSAPAKTSSSSGSTSSASGATSETASFGAGDLGIVNYALTLEYLEDQFYAKVAASGLFSGSTLSLLKTFGAEEAQHVAALHAVAMKLGTPAKEPTGKFPLKSAASVASLAATVENLGAAAYLGQAPLIKSPEILAAALAIHTVEGRHAATLNTLTKQSPTPDGAFAKGMSASQVLAVVKPFIA